MKTIIPTAICSLFIVSGCSFVKLNKLVENQKITLKDDKVSFDVVGNRILLRDDVNFYLDLGAPNLLYPDKIGNLKVTDSIKIGELEAANGTKIENKSYVFERIENKMFRVDQAVFRVMSKDVNCDNQRGLIGCELFTDQILKIDFDKNYVAKIDKDKIQQAISGFTKAKTVDFDGYYFQIEIVVDGKALVAKLDTGNKYDLLLKKDDYDKIRNGQFYSYFKTKGVTDTLYNSKNSASIGQESNNPLVIKSNKYIKRNLLGTGYMKNYNWIIDFVNGAVYYQKIKDNLSPVFPNRAIIADGHVVFYQTDDQSKINQLGHRIKSVKNAPVSAQNQCEILNLLNMHADWDSLQIQFAE